MATPVVASDELVEALARRGFVPWASDYVGEPRFQPGDDRIIFGSGFLLRLPVKVQARQFLVATGTKVVIVDRINEVGPLGLSTEAAAGLGLPTQGAASPVTLQIIALQRRAVANAGPAQQPAPQTKARPSLAPKEAPVPTEVRVDPVRKPVIIPPEDVSALPIPSVTLRKLEPSALGDSVNTDDSAPLGPSFLGEVLADISPTSDTERVEPIIKDAAEVVAPNTAEEITFVITAGDQETSFDQVLTGGDFFVVFSGENIEQANVPQQELPSGSDLAPLDAPSPPPRIVLAAASKASRNGGQRLFLQAGFFQDQGNANRLRDKLKALGISASVRPEDVNGIQHWRVLAGPFSTTAARGNAKARGGTLLQDAYPIRLR